MGSEKFQYRVAKVWLKSPLSIEEILEKLSVKPLLRGAMNFTGTRGTVNVLVRIRWGTAMAARKLDIYADRDVDKDLKSSIEQALPILTPKDFAEEGRAILEKQRDEDESELWEKAKPALMRIVSDLCEHPIFLKERDRRITRKIGFPAYFAWVAAGRESGDQVDELSRSISGEIVRELADAIQAFAPPDGLST